MEQLFCCSVGDFCQRSFLCKFEKVNSELRMLESLICTSPSCIQQCLMVQSAMLYEKDIPDFHGLWKFYDCINALLYLELRKPSQHMRNQFWLYLQHCWQLLVESANKQFYLCVSLTSSLHFDRMCPKCCNGRSYKKELSWIIYNSVLRSSGAIESNMKLNIKYSYGIHKTLQEVWVLQKQGDKIFKFSE